MRARGRAVQQEGLPGAAAPGEPRVPHEDRRAGGRAAAQGARPASTCARRGCRSSATSRPTSTRRTPRPSRTSSAGRSPRPCAGSRASSGSTPRARGPSSRSARSGRSRASSTTSWPTSTDVMSLFTNRPRPKELASFNQALAGLYAAGYGAPRGGEPSSRRRRAPVVRAASPPRRRAAGRLPPAVRHARRAARAPREDARVAAAARPSAARPDGPYDRNDVPQGSIVISGTGLGLPGADKPVMDPKNAARILAGEQFVGPVPQRHREGMARRRVTQLVKTADGSGHFETIDDPKDVIKLAGRAGLVRPRRRVRRAREARRGARLDDPARDRRRPRRAARGGHPARADLEEDDHRQVPARALDAAGVDARRDGRRLRERLPGLQPLRRRGGPLLHVREPARAEAAARGAARDDARRRHPLARSRGGSPSSTCCSRRSRTRSTGASCCASSRWATASSPSTSARAGRTPTSTSPAPPRRPASRWPRTGSARAAAAAWSWSAPTT